jgi:hypothetical protein
MRYLIGSGMGLATVPFILLVGVAYVWVMERLLGSKVEITKPAEKRLSVTKAA